MSRSLPPYRTFLASDSEIRDLLRDHRTIAFCGLATHDDAAIDVARRLKQYGYRVVPVRGDAPEVLGVAAAESIATVPEKIGIALVWRGSPDPAVIVTEAAEAAVAAVWFDVGAEDPDAAYLASQSGMTAVMGRSIIGEYEMHFTDEELGLED